MEEFQSFGEQYKYSFNQKCMNDVIIAPYMNPWIRLYEVSLSEFTLRHRTKSLENFGWILLSFWYVFL